MCLLDRFSNSIVSTTKIRIFKLDQLSYISLSIDPSFLQSFKCLPKIDIVVATKFGLCGVVFYLYFCRN